MQIKVFGPPSVWRDGTQLGGALAQRRRLALLCLLAVGAPPGRPALSRERVLGLLWPSDDDERARAALSQALYALRRDLGADDAITGSGDLRLNPQRVQCDYWDFLQALAEGADRAAAELRVAPLLEGLDVPDARDFEFWAEEQRLDADRQWAAATDRVAAAALREGDTAAAVRWRRALANADPLSGRTAVALALALDAAGEREAALRHLRVHAALVTQELESAPGVEVQRLMEQLAQPAVPAAAPSAATSAPTDTTAPSAAAAAVPPAPVPPAAVPTPAPPSPPTAPPSGAPRLWWGAAALAVAALAAVVLRPWAPRSGTGPDALGALDARSTDASPSAAAPIFAVGGLVGDSLGAAVAGMLATNLSRGQGIEVIGHARMLELTARGEPALAAARAAGATELVDGTLLRRGATWQLELRRTTVATGRVAGAVRASGADVFAIVDRASAELLRGVAPALPAEGIAEVSTRSVEAWRLYEDGLRAKTDGRLEAARAFFRGALRADSTFAMAALALHSVPGVNDPRLLEQAVRLSTRAPEPVRLWILATWYQATDDPRAGAVVDSMVARYPTDVDVQMMVAGPALFSRADFASAHAALDRVWRRDSARAALPGQSRCYTCEATTHLVTVLNFADSLDVAERYVRRLLALRPTDAVAWGALADVLERDPARHDAMQAAVDSSVKYGHPGTLDVALRAATRRGDTVAFDAVARQLGWPASVPVASQHWSRALLYRNVGRLDDALREARAYARTLRGGSAEDGHTRRTLEAAILLERGEARAAAAIWDSIARLPRPEATPSKRARQRVFFGTLAATARFEAGDTTGLAALADSLAVVGAGSGYARDRALHHHVRGLAELAAGRRDNAIAELQRSIVYPSAGFTRSNWYLARALAAAGRRREARAWYAAAARGARDGAALYVNPRAVRQALAALGGA